MPYIRNAYVQTRHDAGVRRYAQQLIFAGWSVCADIPGFVRPSNVGGFIPDIYAIRGYSEYMVEIETADSVNSSHALDQRNAFTGWRKLSASRQFEVITV